METRYRFTLMTPAEFGPWLQQQNISRMITRIQNHHTWLPNYSNFNGSNHFEKLLGMRSSHLERGFSDIAQNITIFPDGKVAICRPLEVVPAGIAGWNSKSICIEHLGNFDIGKDQMTTEQRNAILLVNAHLCHKFGLTPDTDSIVYHHWFDLSTLQRTNGSGNTKTCPGTAFFGGNTVEKAREEFIPLIAEALNLINQPKQTQEPETNPGVVTASSSLNIRSGPGKEFAKTGSLAPASFVNILEEKDGWYRISKGNEWVFGNYVAKLEKRVAAAVSDIRSGPGDSFVKLGNLQPGDSVYVYATQGQWSRIDFIDKWVKLDNLNA